MFIILSEGSIIVQGVHIITQRTSVLKYFNWYPVISPESRFDCSRFAQSKEVKSI